MIDQNLVVIHVDGHSEHPDRLLRQIEQEWRKEWEGAAEAYLNGWKARKHGAFPLQRHKVASCLLSQCSDNLTLAELVNNSRNEYKII